MNENLTMKVQATIRASRERVFAAWTKPEEVVKWFAPGPFKAQRSEIDVREGGVFRIWMKGVSPQTGEEMAPVFDGVYQEVVVNELLRFTWGVDMDVEGPTLVTVMFKDVEGGTEVDVTQERIPNGQLLARNRGGWTLVLEKLAAVMA